MYPRPITQKILTLLAVFSMLLSSFEPIVYAQASNPVYLPLVANGANKTHSDLLLRSHITVNTTAQWQTLTRSGALILDKGDSWALVLVDDQQLTDLARWRFNPEETNALATLAGANAALAQTLQPLLNQMQTTQQQLDALTATSANGKAEDNSQAASIRAPLRAAVQALDEQQRSVLTAAASVDTDNDGLTDDQEGYWCTDSIKPDSDLDGTSDGNEVKAIKAWMNNQRSGPPSTGKPFQGWPPQKTNCFDDDRDSVPDVAESLEVGLNPNLESTDHDKFDDGQELFGVTNCPGGDTNCGYGDLPRSSDSGYVGSTMPAWVKAPGNHPLVAAFPKPEIDVVESSFKVATVTIVTTDHTISSGTEKSYSTAKTEGTSTSVADTVSWNEWQEVSHTTPGLSERRVLDPYFALNSSSVTPGTGYTVSGAILGFGAALAVGACVFLEPCGAVAAFGAGLGLVGAGSAMYGAIVDANADLGSYDPTTPKKTQGQTTPFKAATDQDAVKTTSNTAKTQDRVTNLENTNYFINNNSLSYQKVYPVIAPIKKPETTITQGRSHGGAQTNTHTQYEEHTVTNGEAFSNGEAWGNATAVDSTHAADLTFTYKVRNTGTEYAREIGNLAFNLYIGDDPNPAYTYFVAPDLGGDGKFHNFMPVEEHQYTSRHIPLTLNQMKAINLRDPIRIVVEDFTYGADELFYQDAANAGVMIAIEDGKDDGDENIDNYLIPTWSQETVLNVLARYFPNETDSNGTITAIWTPEYRSDTPSWCQSPRRPTDQPTKVVWCKHVLSTADWWNVYTDGMGDDSEGFQDTQAVPGSVALFRFNKDTDLDGFSDRSEKQLGTDPNDASSFPHPELLAGVRNVRTGNQVISTLSLLNTGFYDAYGVEAIIVAPDDSTSITNNTVGGSGRVRALKQVIVGSRIAAQSPLPAAWTQANHAKFAAGGYYTGAPDRTYTFAVNCSTAGGCSVGSGSWTLNWNDGKGASGSLDFSTGYKSPNFLPVGSLGVTLALYTGNVANGDSFTVAANTPRDTFQYTINREPYTEPMVIVSYNDPQGNHRFVVPPAAMHLTQPTDNLQQFAGTMLPNVGVELVTSAPFTVGSNTAKLLVNNPADKTFQNAHLYLEVINVSGTVVSEVPTQVNLPPGPTSAPVSFNTSSFNPAYQANQDYIVMAFLTDYQGNILDTAGRPLSSFQVDPLPKLASDDATLTWNFGTAAQGALLKHPLALANTGFGRLYTYISPASGLALTSGGSRTTGAADQPTYELTLRTADLPVGAYNQTITIATSDPTNPARTLRVQGTITAATGDGAGGAAQRPLDVAVNVPGSHTQGEWFEFTHSLGPEPQSLHPVKVYSQDYATLWGVGKYATAFGQGTASYDMFGDGRDGAMPASGNLDYDQGFGVGVVNSGSVGSASINVSDSYGAWRINPGDIVLIHQTQGNNAGCWEINKSVSDIGRGTDNYQMAKPLRCNYFTSGNNRAQILRVPQYVSCNSTGTLTPLFPWNGIVGGIFAVMCRDFMNITGTINASAYGFRGGISYNGNENQGGQDAQTGEGSSGSPLWQVNANGNGGGGGHQNSGGGPGGGGGGHGFTGNQGTPGGGATPGYGGFSVGLSSLGNLNFGGGGGGGARAFSNPGGTGGAGGGAVIIYAKNLTVAGNIVVNGVDGASGSRRNPPPENQYGNSGGGGAGAGGSILLQVQSASLGNSKIVGYGASGGSSGGSGAGYGGNGSSGRIRVEYCESVNGDSNPPASMQKLNCYIVEQVETTPYTTARLNLPETLSNGRTYNVQFGRKMDLAAAGEQVTTLRVPAGLVASATLDMLVSNVGAGSLNLKLDIGNDGVWEWDVTQTVDNAATLPSPNLAAAFNNYWTAHGAPTTGTLDVPVKLSLSKPAQALLTNLQLSSTPSVLRTVRLAATETYANFNLDFTVGEGSTGPVTVALDVGDNGSIDWTPASGQTAPVRLTTGNLATAINSYLTGRSGEVDVPVRIYISPLSTVRLNDFSATIAPKIDLVANSVGVSASAVTAANTDSMLINAGDSVTLQATLGSSGGASGAVTAAFFASAPGWGDWYIGSAFVSNISAGGSAPVSVVWNTTGFSGTVPVKVVINPYCRMAETNCKNNSKSTTVTVNPPLTIPVAPSNLVATAASMTQINLSWADNSNNETGFKLERSLDGATNWTALVTVGANVTSYPNTGLTCGTTYYYRVRATNAAGDSAYSNSANAKTTACIPLAPSNLAAAAVSATQINLSWTDNSNNETGFKIERSPDGTTGWAQIATVAANVAMYANTGLTCGTAYYYRVRAYNTGGDSTYSNVANARTVVCPPSPPPSNLLATAAGTTQINLSWTDNITNEESFKIERSPDGTTGWTQIAVTGANMATYANTGLTCGTTYYYRVRASNAGGDSGYSNIATAQTTVCPTPTPMAPDNLVATTAGPAQINLSWVDKSTDESNFKLERSLDGATGWVQVATVSANVVSYANTGLTCGTAYYYRVRASNAGGDSGYSNIATAQTTVCPPPTPSNLAATTVSQTQMNLSWTDNSNNEDGFKLERSPDGTTGWTQIATIGANVTSYANTGLTCGTTYAYRVRAYNAGGDSGYSNVATGQTVTCPTPTPVAPSNLAATTAGPAQINLSWTDNITNETSFKIERSPDGTTGWAQIATVAANVATYANTGITCGITYYYRVRAYNAGGDSAYSNVANALPPCPTPIPPSNLVATAASQTQINLGWKDNSNNESSFKIERSPNGTSGWAQIDTVGADVATYANSGLTCGTKYYYRVRASNTGGDSAYSNVVNAQTTACSITIIAPSNLVATAAGQTQINLSWKDNSKNETGFKVERSPDGNTSWTQIATVAANVKTYADTSSTCGTSYSYRVRAYNTGGDSAYTNVANVQADVCIVDQIFSDGFESGDLSKWSPGTNPTNLSVTAGAALVGTKGLQVTLNSNTATYLTDETPNAEPRYRARFYFDPNTMAMKSNDAHYIFYGYSGTATVVLRVEFRFASNKYQLSAGLVDDKTTWKSTSWVPISDAPHRVELDWQASTTPTAKNGSLTFWVDGVQSKAVTKIDNDTRRIDRVQLGAVFGIDTGTRGAYYFDAFESHRLTAIGLARNGATDVAPEVAMITDTVAMSDTAAEIMAPTVLVSTTVQPGADHRLAGQVDGLRVNVNFAADAAAEPVTAAIAQPNERTGPDGYTGVGSPFAIQLQAADGAAVVALQQPFTLTVDYGDLLDSLPTPSALTLQTWDADTETWTLVPATVNVDAHTITAMIAQPATLALFQPEETRHEQIYLPVIQQ